MVTDISAQASGQQIEIKWNLPPADAMKNTDALIVFRSRQAFSSGTQLASSLQIATLTTKDTSFIDDTCGIYSWYYTVTARYTDGTLYDLIIPTVNATVYATGVSSVAGSDSSERLALQESVITTASSSIRETPLPYLHLFQDDPLPSEDIEAETLEEASRFGLNAVTKNKVKPYIFADDENENVTGDEYILFNIIDTFFSRNEWAAAEAELKRFLQTNKSAYITAKAEIYTGQTLFFQGKYRDALSYFMWAQKACPELDSISKRWIQYSLDYFELPNNS